MLLEVKEHCSFTDYFIICSGASKRQVQALSENLEEDLSKIGVKPLGVEGREGGLWVLMDYNTVVIHLFFQELRDFYDLEGLWANVLQSGTLSPPSARSSSPTAAESSKNRESKSESSGHE